MRTLRIVGVIAAFAVLLLGSMMVYTTFDRYSHSTSDTLLSFIITMAPVWAAVIAGIWVWLHPSERRHNTD